MVGKAKAGNSPKAGQVRTAALDHALWGTETSPGSGIYTISWISPLDETNLASGSGVAHVSSTAPDNTDLLWLDTNIDIWRFYNGSVWWPIGGTILTNRSGGQLVKGDLVVLDTSNSKSVTTTTTQNQQIQCFIAEETIADQSTGIFRLLGSTKVQISGSASIGNGLHTSSSAKKGQGLSSSGLTGRVGFFTGSGTDSLVDCFLYGQPRAT